MLAQLQSPFHYPGSKRKVAGQVAALLSPSFAPEQVVDVFMGGGALLLHFAELYPKATLVANDLDPRMAAFWRCMVDPTLAAELSRLLPDTLTKEDKDDASEEDEETDPPVRLALRALIKDATSWQHIQRPEVGTLGKDSADRAYDSAKLRGRCAAIAKAMTGRLEVFQESFETLVQRYDQPGTLLLLDPPYLKMGKQLYRKFFTEEQHHQLAACVNSLKHALWVMTNGMDPLTYSLYGNKDTIVFPLRVSGAHGSRLERRIVPKRVLFPDGEVKRAPATDRQYGADFLESNMEDPTYVALEVTKRSRGVKKSGLKAQSGAVTVLCPDAIVPLTRQERDRLAQAETAIEEARQNILDGFVDIGDRLNVISDRKLYRETHGTFADYCEKRWTLSVGRAYQLIRGARVYHALRKQFAGEKSLEQARTDGLVPVNEAQVRALVPLAVDISKDSEIDAVCEVWGAVLARTRAGETLTAELVGEEVARWEKAHGREPPAGWDWRSGPLGNLGRIESRISQASDIKTLDRAMNQLRQLLDLLDERRRELAVPK